MTLSICLLLHVTKILLVLTGIVRGYGKQIIVYYESLSFRFLLRPLKKCSVKLLCVLLVVGKSDNIQSFRLNCNHLALVDLYRECPVCPHLSVSLAHFLRIFLVRH